MANESQTFISLKGALFKMLDDYPLAIVYFVIDNASKDDTYSLCKNLAEYDRRFIALWRPNCQNVVDAYWAGFQEAIKGQHDFIIEMDAGLSHDPRAISSFIRVLNEGNDCAFGSRFINGGSIYQSNWRRHFLSNLGTYLSNYMLGTNYKDATSGYQGFSVEIITKLLEFPIKSKAHFYQTEIRYLLRYTRYIEVPIHYRAPSPRVSWKAIRNSAYVLIYYFIKRLTFKAPSIS